MAGRVGGGVAVRVSGSMEHHSLARTAVNSNNFLHRPLELVEDGHCAGCLTEMCNLLDAK